MSNPHLVHACTKLRSGKSQAHCHGKLGIM